MSQMVKIACLVPNGIALRLFKKGYDDGTGFRPMTHDGPTLFLPGPSVVDAGVGNSDGAHSEPVLTDVDAEWWEKWQEQNAQNPLLEMKRVYRFEEPAEERPDPNPTE